MLIQYIRRFYFALFFLAPLIMNSRTSEIFEFNKMLLIYTSSIIVFSLWLIHKIVAPGPLLRPRFLVVLSLFLATQILSTIFSIDPHTSVFGYYGRFNGGLLSIIAYLTLFFVFLQTFDTFAILRLLKISVISSVLVILWGFSGKVGLDFSCLVFTGQLTNECWTAQFQPAVRMFSTIGQPNWLGAYLAIHFFIGIYFLLETLKNHGKNRNVLYFYLLSNFMALLFTRSRSSLLALGIGLITFIVLLFFIKQIKTLKDHVRSISLFAIAISLVVLTFKTGIPAVDRFIALPSVTQTQTDPKPADDAISVPSSSNVTDSFDIRQVVWKGALDLGFRYPILGTGVETFAYSYYETRPLQHNQTSEWDFIYNKAHNEYLNYFATTGFIGVVSYILMIGSTIYLFIRSSVRSKKYSLLNISLLCSYVTILVTNFFGFSTTTINLFFYILPAVPIVLDEDPVKGAIMKEKVNWWKYLPVGLTVLVMLFLLGKVINYFRADVIYAKANQHMGNSQYQQALYAFDDALNLRYEHVYEDKMSFALANLSYMASEQKEDALATKLLNLSRGYNNKTLAASPRNVLYWKTTAKNEYLFYQATNNVDSLTKAIEALTLAETLAPTDPRLPYSQALFYSALAQSSEKEKEKYKKLSLEQIDRSINLKPNYRDAYMLKGQILRQFEETDKSRQVFEFMLKTFDPNDVEVKEELKAL